MLSLLMPDEAHDLGLDQESKEVKAQGMTFLSLPIQDRQTPDSEFDLANTLEEVETELASGKNVVVHCRQGVGRAGLVAACLLVAKGWSPDTAVNRLTAKRGVSVPETPEQSR